MKYLILMILLALAVPAHALTLINNTARSINVSVNGISGTLKPHAIVEFNPPKLKSPFRIHASGLRSKGKSFSCKTTVSDKYAVVTLPDECR